MHRHRQAARQLPIPWLIAAACLFMLLYNNYAITLRSHTDRQDQSDSKAPDPTKAIQNDAASGVVAKPRKAMGDEPTDETIFVSVASYRDPHCSHTLADIFEKASKPHRVFVGVADQINITNSAEECIDRKGRFASQIRTVQLTSDHGRGPTFARYLISLLYQGEDYFFMTDSHMKFEPGWDDIIINMWHDYSKRLESDHVIISHYPLAYNVDKDEFPAESKDSVSAHCNGFFNADGIWQPTDTIVAKTHAQASWIVPVAGANMMFAPGLLVKEVPFDPFLPHLFHGEEITYSVRAWGKGWKVYSPNTNVVYHYYFRNKDAKSWDDHKDSLEGMTLSLQRIKVMLGILDASSVSDPMVLKDFDYYAVPLDAVQQWERFFGIDLRNKKFETNFCTPKYATFKTSVQS